jgi:four helix bundle protein
MHSFQRLDVYRCSIQFLALSARLSASLPKGNAPLSDQLRRAALSVPLNIAEAAGRTTEADGARHYAIARGSAMECAAIMDAQQALGLANDQEHQEAVELLARILAMSTKLCR